MFTALGKMASALRDDADENRELHYSSQLCLFVCLLVFFVIYSFGAKLRNTIIFLEIFVIECCTVLLEPPLTSSLYSFAYYKNVTIFETKKDIPKWKTSFLFALKSLSNFYFLDTLICFIECPFQAGNTFSAGFCGKKSAEAEHLFTDQ